MPITIGPLSPDSASAPPTGFSQPISNPGNVLASDNNRATGTIANFEATDPIIAVFTPTVPSGAIVTAMRVGVECSTSVATAIEVQVSFPDIVIGVSPLSLSPQSAPAVEGVLTFATPVLIALHADEITSYNVSVRLSNFANIGSADGAVDHITLEVDYITEGGGGGSVRMVNINGGADQ